MPNRSKFSDTEISFILEQYRSGVNVESLTEQYGISKRTIFRWQNKIQAYRPDLLKLVKDLREENAKLKNVIEEMKKSIEIMLQNS